MRRLKALWLIAAVAPALLLALLAHHLDVKYPRPDGSLYATTSLDIWHALQDKGPVAALDSAMFNRRIQPVIQPAIAAPVFILFDGDTRRAVAAVEFGCFAAFLAFVFAALNLVMPPLSAVAGTWFVSGLPWVFKTMTSFGSELTLLAFLAPFLYFWARSNDFRALRHSILAGVCFGLCVCARIVEPVLAVGVPIAVITAAERFATCPSQRRGWALGPAALAALFIVFVLVTGRFAVFWGEAYFAPLVVLALAAPAFLLLRTFRARPLEERAFVSAACAAYLIVVCWYAPAARMVAYWVTSGTYGKFIRLAGESDVISISQYLSNVFTDFLSLPALAIGACAGLSMAFAKSRTKWIYLAAIALAWLLFLGLGLSTYSRNEVRYYTAPWLITFLAGIVAALDWKAPLRRMRLALVTFVAIAQLFSLYYAQLLRVDNPPLKTDPAVSVIDGLEKIYPRKEPLSIWYIPRANYSDLNITVLQLLVAERRLAWQVATTRPDLTAVPDPEVPAFIRSKYDVVLIDPSGDRSAGVWDDKAFMKFGERLIQAARRHAPLERGFQYRGSIPYKADKHESVMFVFAVEP